MSPLTRHLRLSRLASAALLAIAVLAAAGFTTPQSPPSPWQQPRLERRQQPRRQQQPQQQRQMGDEVWPGDWFSDLPAVEMTGIWVFDPDNSDPMLSEWAGKEVRYEINQQGAFIVLEFIVPGSQSNTQNYRWDSIVERFQRGGREVEEAARWTDAGRMLEVIGRHWDPETPDERSEYRMTYVVEGDVLTFVQESESGRTVWRFDRKRQPPAGHQPAGGGVGERAPGR